MSLSVAFMTGSAFFSALNNLMSNNINFLLF
jgi:hypothetical protein